jgi:hypothetical protein
MSSGSHRERIQDEMRRRAAHHKSQKHLIVDYYRIRRRVAYPLPVTGLNIPTIPIPDIPVYPWATWMTWALEERVNALGWATQWFGDEEARETVECDLLHLAQWPEYQQYPSPDLSLGHAARILANSYRQWPWLSPEVRNAIQAAMQRIVAQSGPLVEERLQPYGSVADILTANEPHIVVANIPTIGALGVALAANAVNLPEKQTLNVTIKKVLLAMLAQRENGFSEGVAYNGYVLDFVLDWLPFLTSEEQAVFLNHPELGHYFDESLWMGAPGDAAFVAELGDVEARQMPFHIGAQAKMWKFKPLPERAWYLLQCRLAWLRADGLAALRELPEGVAVAEPETPAAKDAHCAVVLRNGWAGDDVAVVAASSNSPMGHVPANYGSLSIGTKGQWLIQTPGYQQYVKTSEREFTIGKVSRNTPVIDGGGVSQKNGRIVQLEDSDDLVRAVFDLSGCYGVEGDVMRTVTLSTSETSPMVLVEDRIGIPIQDSLEYYWHGHPEAAWWVQDGWAMLTLNGTTLWFTSPQFVIDGTSIQRLRGSRGQLTLVNNFSLSLDKNLKPPEMVHWLFTFQDECPGSAEPIIQRLKNLKVVGDS